MSFEDLEIVLGQKKAFEYIINNYENKKYLITGNIGQGKHFLITKILNFFSAKDNLIPVLLTSNDNILKYSVDYAPFITSIATKESVIFSNFESIGKSLFELIPYIGDLIEKINNRKRIYPAIFNDSEVEILIRLKKINPTKQIVLICEEIESWDSASIILLNKLVQTKNIKSLGIINILCSSCSEQEVVQLNVIDKIFQLEHIPFEKFENVIGLLMGEKKISSEKIKQLFKITQGNIGLIKSIIDNMEKTNEQDFLLDNFFIITLLKKIRNMISESDFEITKELINRASVIGTSSYKQLLKKFLNYPIQEFNSGLKNAVESNILLDAQSTVDFTDSCLWKSFNSFNEKNISYHFELAEAIKKITPSNFEYIANEYFLAQEEEESVIYFILSALTYFKIYRKKPLLTEMKVKLLKKYNLESYYSKICFVYTQYFEGKKIFNRVDIKAYDKRLIFEVEYIQALFDINFSLDSKSYNYSFNKIEKWVSDDDFLLNNPYQWTKAAMLTLEMKNELNHKDISLLYKKLDGVIINFLSIDKHFEYVQYDFFSKCNIYYSVDTAYIYTFEAVKYFAQETIPANSYQLYVALVNFSANALVLGKYKESIQYSQKAIELIKTYFDIKFNFIETVISNMSVAILLDSPDFNFDQVLSLINELKKILKNVNDIITKAFLLNNIAIMYCYSNNFSRAFKIMKTLYEYIKDNIDIDDYYKYLIFNNFYILDFFINNNYPDELCKILSDLCPLKSDKNYFIARNNYVSENLHKEIKIDFTKKNWNDFEQLKIGPGWSFWGKWLLFTDIQFWTD